MAPAAIPLCFTKASGGACPSSNTGTPHPLDIPIVALMGMIGGALSATLAIQRLRTTAMPTPYAIPVSLALLKLPAGALTAIGGLLLIHGEFVPGLSNLDSQGQILAYAIVLGVAQQVVTRFVDQKAETVLAAVPSKARPPTGQPARTATLATWHPSPARRPAHLDRAWAAPALMPRDHRAHLCGRAILLEC